MCGIVGIITAKPLDQARLAVRRMMAHSHHRGPDGKGEAAISLPGDAGHLVLGHTRLSIIDLSNHASQPMQDSSSGCWLVYNGEIYNFQELRCALQQQGIEFTSAGDSEVLLKALVHWGEGALPRLHGMFAFAFWNARRHELLLARDSFGIKPLYYFHTTGTFLFSSEVKILQASQVHQFDIDSEGLESFLAFGAVLGPSTILKNVKELEPGSLLRISGSQAEPLPCPYTRFATHVLGERDKNPSFNSAVEQVTHDLRGAVKSHLVSDVPVGIPLSGGIDSSLLACLAAEQHNGINLLTIGFSEQEFSEIQSATEMARHLNMPHRIVHLAPADFNDLLSGALGAIDQPTVDGINTFVISKLAASVGLRVLLSGLGGDELFGGYTTFRKAPLLWRYRFALRHLARLAGKLGGNSVRWAKLREAIKLRNLGEAYLLQRCIRWKRFGEDVVKNQSASALFDIEQNKELAGMDDDNFLKIAWLELSIYMRYQLLRDADVFSMANSVELRVPFLDINVAKTALALPRPCHFDMHGGKRVTRSVLEQVSGRRIRRKKMGFTFPWVQWLQGPIKCMLTETLHERSLYDSLGLDFQYGQGLLARLGRQKAPVSWMEIWSLFVLLEWQKRNGCALAKT